MNSEQSTYLLKVSFLLLVISNSLFFTFGLSSSTNNDYVGQQSERLDISDFWNNRAHWELVSKSRFDEYDMTMMNVGFSFVTQPSSKEGSNVWYLFHREYNFQQPKPQPSYCKYDYARIVVRKSLDKGLSWSDPVIVAEPPKLDKNSSKPIAADECAITDGSGYFDSNTNQWHYIGQCINRTNHWNLCHYTKLGEDPMDVSTSQWIPNQGNPVVYGGQLWSQICKKNRREPTKHCAPDTHDEGTPEIVFTDDEGFHYVTFHGVDGTGQKAARGVAKTKDFVTWTVKEKDKECKKVEKNKKGKNKKVGEGYCLPNDAIYSWADCMSWNVDWHDGKCVGGGEGSTLISSVDGYMYMLIESADVNLSCTDDQNWVLGLLRSKTFSPSQTWEQMPMPNKGYDNQHLSSIRLLNDTKYMEPVVVPAEKKGCYIQYHRLFQDSEGTYLEYWTGADNNGWMQIYKLVPGAGTLPIVATEDI